MGFNDGMKSSSTYEWETPQWLFNDLNQVYGFTLDVCASEQNRKCDAYYTKEQDGLKKKWHGTCWMNPPYGRNIGKWVEKAYTASTIYGATVVCLLPARTDTRWFHDYVYGKAEVTFLKGRLRFGGAKVNAPFPSMVAVYSAKWRQK